MQRVVNDKLNFSYHFTSKAVVKGRTDSGNVEVVAVWVMACFAYMALAFL